MSTIQSARSVTGRPCADRGCHGIVDQMHLPWPRPNRPRARPAVGRGDARWGLRSPGRGGHDAATLVPLRNEGLDPSSRGRRSRRSRHRAAPHRPDVAGGRPSIQLGLIRPPPGGCRARDSGPPPRAPCPARFPFAGHITSVVGPPRSMPMCTGELETSEKHGCAALRRES